MENASKALLIAGGVLIAIIIITLAVILYTLFSNHSENYNEVMKVTQIQKFNSKFDVYIGREDITAQELISVVNLSNEYNGSVEILIDNHKIPQGHTSEDFIDDNNNKTFTCQHELGDNPNPEYNEETGKITKIRFTKNT